MAGLDMQYIAELVRQAQEGDSNAFAEMYAATCQGQYALAFRLLGEAFPAQRALQSAYTQAVKKLSMLREPTLVVVWLTRLTLQAALAVRQEEAGAAQTPESRTLRLRNAAYSVRQIMTLPLSESQTLLLRGLCGMKTDEIAALLEMKRSDVRRCMRSGMRRLEALSAGKGGERA